MKHRSHVPDLMLITNQKHYKKILGRGPERMGEKEEERGDIGAIDVDQQFILSFF